MRSGRSMNQSSHQMGNNFLTLDKKLRVFIPFALGYFLSYLYRVVNAVLAPDLAAELGVGPSELGLLTAAYFITFAAFQLPLGILLDRFGSRKIESLLLIFAAAGAFVFSEAESVTGLVIGRALIGFGVSACLMAAFKAFVTWFRKEQLPLINGIQMASGGFGALTATAPVEAALGITDWRGIFLILSILTLAVAATVFFVVPEKKIEQNGDSIKVRLRAGPGAGGDGRPGAVHDRRGNGHRFSPDGSCGREIEPSGHQTHCYRSGGHGGLHGHPGPGYSGGNFVATHPVGSVWYFWHHRHHLLCGIVPEFSGPLSRPGEYRHQPAGVYMRLCRPMGNRGCH